METISLEAVAEILGLQKSRIEQWISREHFRPRFMTQQGQKRKWDQAEVIRLAVFAELVDEGFMQPTGAQRLTSRDSDAFAEILAGRLTSYGVHGFVDDGAFFVCYKTEHFDDWSSDIVRKRDIATYLSQGCESPKVLMTGYSEEAKRHNSEKLLGPASVAITIDLDRIERRVLVAWPKV
ncbi:MerR family transcriptional regulator [Agrobacterium tumefaciens]|uniref:MerR family transcriptional regulator n=1 Tax=Agrobacterium tumefaciens TaxID=358 RepID=UPI002786A685|nr:MerR family transcriptional regulator [Agrobacterium tumefaciens]MDP9789281.1 hypothetical protein [Agrobacterium tumefaciens]